MKQKWEYMLIDPRSIIAVKRDATEGGRKSQGDEVLLMERLNELGQEQWEILGNAMAGFSVLAKRPVIHNGVARSTKKSCTPKERL